MSVNEKMTAIANAIRTKTGTKDKMSLDQMAEKIMDIDEIPQEFFLIDNSVSGNSSYMFNYNNYNWIIEKYGHKIKTKDVFNPMHMFSYSSELKKIPFAINLRKTNNYLNDIFNFCSNLTEIPKVNGNLNPPQTNSNNNPSVSFFFHHCIRVRNIDSDFFAKMCGDEFWKAAKRYSADRNAIFSNDFSLRKLPNISMLKNKATPSLCLYHNITNNCYVLDEVNFPVLDAAELTSNAFVNTFSNCNRLKNIIFETNSDGTPIVAKWTNQTIDLRNYVGFAPSDGNITNYNSGITTSKKVTNDVTYDALKDDPDWYTTDMTYCRYDHDSAVRTINSLPDTSEYIRTKGGTNTIKFKANAGSKTDGGAINTLTQEEIAVATAKGWTVTI